VRLTRALVPALSCHRAARIEQYATHCGSRCRRIPAERSELQTLLLARGHPIGEADGMIGSLSRRAIRDEQARIGLPQDGRAGMKLLAALRRDPPAASR
jgi:hypothetical protein